MVLKLEKVWLSGLKNRSSQEKSNNINLKQMQLARITLTIFNFNYFLQELYHKTNPTVSSGLYAK